MVIYLLRRDGIVSDEAAKHAGGKYGFFQRLMVGGTGSPIVYYQYGLKEFDQVARYSKEINAVSFEILREGYLVRFIKRNKGYAAIFRFKETEMFFLKVFKVMAIHYGIEKARDAAILMLDAAGKKMLFDVPHYKYPFFRRYLETRPYRKYLKIYQSPQEPVKSSQEIWQKLRLSY